MCGIAGIYNFDGNKVDKKILHQMDCALIHRGPDDHGEVCFENVGLANRRLAIIDTGSTGHQPMNTQDGNYWITFNGEIFNYRQLRSDLIKKGYQFKSHSDTETILIGFRHFGEEFVKKLIGQFAFCIWDKKNKRFFLARDQLGVNPLYYAKVNSTFLFASEVKGLLASRLIKKELDQQALFHYTSMFSIPAPSTIIKSIKSLLPGHYMIVDKNGIKINKFWEMPKPSWRASKLSETEIKEMLKQKLIEAISSAKIADVEVGAFLSGGIDSSAVVALMSQELNRPIKTFSIWAEGGEAFDERKFSRMVAERYGCDHHEFTISENDVLSEIHKIVYYFDQPTGGSFENYFISQKAGKKVKVALSGLGGDELFAGYHSIIYQTRLFSDLYNVTPRHIRNLLVSLILRSPFSSDFKKTIKVADKFLQLTDAFKKRLFIYFAFNDGEKKNLFTKSFLSEVKCDFTEEYFNEFVKKVKNAHEIDKLSYLDLQTYTRDDLLLGTNMMGMAQTLETRVPFLDPRLVEFSFSIPPYLKYQKGIAKYILKEALRKYLPEEVINHKKIGFGLPRVRYMKGKLKPLILETLDKKNIDKRGIFNAEYVAKVVNDFYGDKSNKMLWNEHLRVWLLFIFELWAKQYLDGESF